MFTALAIAVVLQSPGYSPYSNQPYLSFSSSPAQQTITAPTNDTRFTQTAEVQDRDTYKNVSDQTELVPNIQIDVIPTIRSGTVIGSPNIATDSDLGKRTFVWTIRPYIPAQTTDYLDNFYGKDLGTLQILQDSDSTTSTNIVTVVIPTTQGGGGSGGGSGSGGSFAR
jgi:hypothetical protein